MVKPWSPIVQAISSSPSGVRVVSSASMSSTAVPASGSRAVTTAAAAPSAKTELATICSASLELVRWMLQSSAATTRTTADGSASQNARAARSPGNAP